MMLRRTLIAAFAYFSATPLLALVEICSSKEIGRPHIVPDKTVERSSLEFMSVGDWGIIGSDLKDISPKRLRAVAKSMDQVASEKKSEFVLSVGDHFYFEGVRSTTDERWKSTFENVFAGDALRSIYWYGVLGNHDHGKIGDGRAEVEYTYAKENTFKRWCIPDFFYRFRYVVRDPGKNSEFGVTFVGIDSTALLHVCNGGCQTATVANCSEEHWRAKLTKGEPAWCKADYIPKYQEQMDFLETELSSAKKRGDWVIVFSHHPVASLGGNYGFQQGPNWGFPEMRDQLASILAYHKVDAQFSGHEHMTEMLLAGNMPVIVTGGGGNMNAVIACKSVDECNRRLGPQYGYHKYKALYVGTDAQEVTGFSDVSLTADKMVVTLRDHNNKVLYSWEKPR